MDFAQENQAGHLDLPRLLQSRFLLQCFAVFCDPKFGQEAALRQTLRLISLAQDKIFSLDQVQWVKGAADISLVQTGKLSGLLAIEGADFLGDDLFLLDLVYDMGVRLITLTWNGRNTLADGVKVGGNGGGLTELGQRAVKRMQDLNIVVDVSHLSLQGFWDVLDVSAKPFVASHSNAWSICQHPRNLKDEQIKEIARCKGLIGMNLCRPFVSDEVNRQTLPTVVEHIRHIADVAGTEVICLGCDLDGIRALPDGMKDVRDVPAVTDLLGKAGFAPSEIEAICAGNLLRFLESYLG